MGPCPSSLQWVENQAAPVAAHHAPADRTVDRAERLDDLQRRSADGARIRRGSAARTGESVRIRSSRSEETLIYEARRDHDYERRPRKDIPSAAQRDLGGPAAGSRGASGSQASGITSICAVIAE